MNSGNGLHDASVADIQTLAVDMFHGAAIGGAVVGNRHTVVTIQTRRHARWPDQLITQIAVTEAMQVRQKLQRILRAGKHWRDVFEQ